MAGKKRKTKQKDSETLVSEIGDNLEHAFLAGLGALSNAQKKGAKTFDSLVKQGEDFRKKASKKTECLMTLRTRPRAFLTRFATKHSSTS
jgi:hypothetical protein